MGRTTGHSDLAPLDFLLGDGCLGRRLRLSHTAASLEFSAATPSCSSSSHSNRRAVTNKTVASFLGVATPVEVCEGRPPNSAPARHRGAVNLRHPEKTSFFFWPTINCGDEKFPVRMKVYKCSDCKDKGRKCDSEDCAEYQGVCYDRLMGKDKVKMHAWNYYWGATRPWLATRDWIHYGDTVWVYGPGKPKEGAKSTDQEKRVAKDEDKEAPLIDFWKPGINPETGTGNKMMMTGTTLKPYPPTRWWDQYKGAYQFWPPMPRSREAEIAIALWMQMMYGGKMQDYLGLEMKPCDYFGRILDGSKDHHFCDDDQVCVTALPSDFDKVAGKMCWKWVEPPKGSREAAHWVNVCKTNAGMPWCVPDSMIKAYDGPIEIKCSASGEKVRHRGYANGCHWFELVEDGDKQRLPGKIVRRYGEEGGWFVSSRAKYKNALDEKDAENWIKFGFLDMAKPQRDEAAFLAKAKPAPKKPKMAGNGDLETRGWFQWMADSWKHKFGVQTF